MAVRDRQTLQRVPEVKILGDSLADLRGLIFGVSDSVRVRKLLVVLLVLDSEVWRDIDHIPVHAKVVLLQAIEL